MIESSKIGEVAVMLEKADAVLTVLENQVLPELLHNVNQEIAKQSMILTCVVGDYVMAANKQISDMI